MKGWAAVVLLFAAILMLPALMLWTEYQRRTAESFVTPVQFLCHGFALDGYLERRFDLVVGHYDLEGRRFHPEGCSILEKL